MLVGYPKVKLLIFSFLLISISLPTIGFASEWQFDNVDRVVAFSDVHGDYERLVDLLQDVEVIDENLDWVGGATHLISTGDLVDRGPRSRDVLDLLMKLQEQAPRSGGRMAIALGNHEIMNLQGDLRYVAKEEYAVFSDEETDAAYASQPPGFIGHRRAFSATGKYGSWLLQQPLMVRVNRTLFVHGGFPPYLAVFNLDWVNTHYKADFVRFVQIQTALVNADLLDPTQSDDDQVLWAKLLLQRESEFDLDDDVRGLLREFVQLFDATVLHRDSVTWYRATAMCHPLAEDVVLSAVLAKFDADDVVMGHTGTGGQARSRLDGRAVLMDTGMLKSHYNGRPSALLFENGVRSVFYGDTNEVGFPEPMGIGERLNPRGMTDAQVETLLVSGEILEIEGKNSQPGSPLRVSLQLGDVQLRALLLNDVSGKTEMAAYRLDRFLGLGMVPVVVKRQKGEEISFLQLQLENSTNELQRQSSGWEIDNWCRINDEYELMYLFDILTGNMNRRASNLLYTQDDWNLYLTGHSQAFSTQREMSPQLLSLKLSIPPLLAERMAALDRKTLKGLLGDLLSSSQIRVLLKRRNDLLKRLSPKTIDYFLQEQ